jgi:hypothetical protein
LDVVGRGLARVHWRWGVVAAGAALLAALPVAIAAVPVSQHPNVSARTLFDQARASAEVSYSGYAESRGTIGLPDIPELGDLASLFGQTTDMRIWWAGPDRWRVDELQTAGEHDMYGDSAGIWQWDSGARQAIRTNGVLPVRLPRASDLVPPQLARRLLDVAGPGDRLVRLPSRNVAGHTGLGLAVIPASTASTVARVEIWVDEHTGLPLATDVVARGQSGAALESQFLDLGIGPVAESVTTFVAPPDAEVQVVAAPDVTAALSTLEQYAWPSTLAGFPRKERLPALGTGVATYSKGFAAVSVLPLSRRLTDEIEARLTGPPAVPATIAGAMSLGIVTPLVDGLLVDDYTNGRVYLLAGTVTLPELERMGEALVASPPPEVGNR